MRTKTWKRGDLDPATGKVFLQYVTTRGKHYAYFVAPERLEEIRAQNRESARQIYWRDPARKIRKVREWQAAQQRRIAVNA